MRPQLVVFALAGFLLPADALLAQPDPGEEKKLLKVECYGPPAMDPYFISFDLDARKAYVQRNLEVPPREAYRIDVLSQDSIEWTGVMRFKFDRRANLLHETAVFTTDKYYCMPMKAENP
jgi:hypothetical protein